MNAQAKSSSGTTSLFYANLIKELSSKLTGLPESGCKGTNFFRINKYFTDIFSENSEKNLPG